MKAFLAGAFAFFVLLLAPTAANAVIIAVNTTADEYGTGTNCSLREAITAAQDNISFGGCPAGFSADTVSLPAGTYKITRAGDNEDGNATGDFDITGTNALDIQPAGAAARVVIDGNQIDRVFDDTSSGLVKLRAIEIKGGKLTGFQDGAGVRNGVGVTMLEDSTVDGNSSEKQAGGVAVYNNVQMVNSTISGNSAGGNGGGLYVTGGASLAALSSTIYGNQAVGYGGGLAETGGLTVSFTNVLNAGNSGTAASPTDDAYDCASGPNFYPRFTLQGQPLGPAECLVGFNPGTNLVSDAPKVDSSLRYNGGQTPTHALLAGSPAINAGGVNSPDECPAIDQNGVGRPAGQCDIGAVEFVSKPSLLITRILPRRTAVKRKKSRVITVSIRNLGNDKAAGVRACLVLPRATKKGLKVTGPSCKSLGAIAVGQTKQAKVKLTAKPNAVKKAYTVKSTVKGNGLTIRSRTFKVRVK